MAESTKIEFRCRRIGQVDDITDLVVIFFPGNRNQQHAAARILLMLNTAKQPMAGMSDLEQTHSISRRTLQRTRAKLARLGLIEHVTWMNSRYGGQQGWILSNRISGALRLLAGKIEVWGKDSRQEKDNMLAELLRP